MAGASPDWEAIVAFGGAALVFGWLTKQFAGPELVAFSDPFESESGWPSSEPTIA